MSRRELYTVESAPAVCAGECRFDTGVNRVAVVGEERGTWGDTEDVAVGAGDGFDGLSGRVYEQRSPSDRIDTNYANGDAAQQPGTSLLQDAGQSVSSSGHAQSSRGSRSRFARSLGGTFPHKEKSNSSLEKVPIESSTDSKGLHVLHRLQQGDGDQQSSTRTPEDGNGDYSGEVEEADPTAILPVGSSSPWGSPVPKVPSSWMTALYFSGRREQLKLKPASGVELPRAKFSLELWVKPEGGQSNPAVIAGGSVS